MKRCIESRTVNRCILMPKKLVFFFRGKTAYEVKECDWSSDVCSSDLYGARTDFPGFLVVGVSQSGRTPEIVRSVHAARAAGGRTVAVTNDSSSPLAHAADLTVGLDAGPERVVRPGPGDRTLHRRQPGQSA